MYYFKKNSFIDLRIFNSNKARGMLNAMFGLYYVDMNIRYLIDSNWMYYLLRANKIPDKNILYLNSFKSYIHLIGKNIILPFQRSCFDILIMKLLFLVSLSTFIHDLHFLSNRTLLKKEFSIDKNKFHKFLLQKLKFFYYIFIIYISNYLYVDSKYVKRQIISIFKMESSLVPLKRIFLRSDIISINQPNVNSRKYDYYIPLTELKYKGLWALHKLVFENTTATVVLDSKFYDLASSILLRRNKYLNLLWEDLSHDSGLIEVLSNSKSTLCLSRYEGFGFVPHEARFFGSIPIVFNCSSFIEKPSDFFIKINLSNNTVFVPDIRNITNLYNFNNYENNHIICI